MTIKKYELVASGIEGLYRVKALRDFGSVKAGDVGGYVAGEHNLSHDGNCWVADDACIVGNARVSGNAWVSGNARVYDNARVYGDAWVNDNTQVYGNACVSGNAWVCDNARVSGNADVSGNAHIYGSATISNTNDYFVVGPALSSGRYTTIHKTAEGYQINCGCYTTDSIKKFKDRVKEVHSGDNLESYLVIVDSLNAWVKSKLKGEAQNANNQRIPASTSVFDTRSTVH